MKKYFFLLSILLTLYLNVQASDFITVWDLSKLGSGTIAINFGIVTSGNVNYNWETIPAGSSGSGVFTSSAVYANVTGLPVGATIRLKMTPTNLQGFNTEYITASRVALIDVEQWGTASWSTMYYAFYGCVNLNISATDIPDLSAVTDMQHMFRDCSILNSPTNINSWNTASVTRMDYLFQNASVFNQPIGNWNTSNVTDFSYMFYGASAFNQPIGNWNTSKLIYVVSTFENAISFNQNINSWNTDSLKYIGAMFRNATSYNQPLDNWNTFNVISMAATFSNANLFNQPLNNWNTFNVISMAYICF